MRNNLQGRQLSRPIPRARRDMNRPHGRDAPTKSSVGSASPISVPLAFGSDSFLSIRFGVDPGWFDPGWRVA